MRSLCCYPMGRFKDTNTARKAPAGAHLPMQLSRRRLAPRPSRREASLFGFPQSGPASGSPASSGRWLQWGLAERRRAQTVQVPDAWAAVHAPAKEPKKSPVVPTGRLRRRRALCVKSKAAPPAWRYLVDPASSHMLVSKIKPCMSKYKLLYTVKLRMAH